jgi:hypothetical protein
MFGVRIDVEPFLGAILPAAQHRRVPLDSSFELISTRPLFLSSARDLSAPKAQGYFDA